MEPRPREQPDVSGLGPYPSAGRAAEVISMDDAGAMVLACVLLSPGPFYSVSSSTFSHVTFYLKSMYKHQLLTVSVFLW